MHLESDPKINFTSEVFPSRFLADSLLRIEEAVLFYADTSKANGQLVTYPMNADINLEDEERRIDGILFGHSSHYEKSRHWPRLHTTIDPKLNQTYQIVEFPVVVDVKQYLSIKQSVKEGDKLIALCYKLARMENEAILSSKGLFHP